jgi:hypothetical protein
MEIIITIVVAVVALAAGILIGNGLATERAAKVNMMREIAELRAKIEEVKTGPKQKCHTHKNSQNIENILAHLIAARFDAAEMLERIDTGLRVAQDWRADPNIDPEKPNRRD